MGCGPQAGVLADDSNVVGTAITGSGTDGPGFDESGAPGSSTGMPTTGGTGDEPAICGNGIVEPPEECDDGNRLNFDGCDWDCVDPGTIQLALGSAISCATEGDMTRCWGDDSLGALGLGRTYGCCDDACTPTTCMLGDDETPASVDVLGLGALRSIAPHRFGTCAAQVDGRIRCWGRSNVVLGDPAAYQACPVEALDQCATDPACCIGDDETAAVATPIEFSDAVVQVVGSGEHTCALLGGGTVYCWGRSEGYRSAGLLGNGMTGSIIGDDEWPAEAPPVNIDGPVVHLSAGSGSTCALLDDGTLRCWGSCSPISAPVAWDGTYLPWCLGYGDGLVVGDDETPAQKGPVPLEEPVVQLATSGTHTCVVLTDGAVRCWGQGFFGQLGYASDMDQGNAAEVGDVDVGGAVARVVAGQNYTCALLRSHEVTCWGIGHLLGRGTSNYKLDAIGDNEVPASVGPIDLGMPARSLAHGYRHSHTCAVGTNGDIRCWGENSYGELGLGMPGSVGDDELPSQVPPIEVFP